MGLNVWLVWHGGVLMLLFLGVYGAMERIHKKDMLRRGVESFYGRICMLSGSREEVKRQLEALYGSTDSRGWIAHITECLEYSGLTARFKWLTPELYLVFLTPVLAAAFIGGWLIASKWYAGLGAAVVVYLLIEYVFGKMRNYRYHMEEEQLAALINLVESYAAESDDIIYILHRAGELISGPLHDEILNCISLVQGGVKTTTALREMEQRIEHPFFKTFIRNLEISSRNNAGYREIVAECRTMLVEQLGSSKKVADIYRSARIRLVTVLAGSLICLDIMAEYMMGTGLADMLKHLSGSVAGRVLLALMCATLLASGYYALIRSHRR